MVEKERITRITVLIAKSSFTINLYPRSDKSPGVTDKFLMK